MPGAAIGHGGSGGAPEARHVIVQLARIEHSAANPQRMNLGMMDICGGGVRGDGSPIRGADIG